MSSEARSGPTARPDTGYRRRATDRLGADHELARLAALADYDVIGGAPVPELATLAAQAAGLCDTEGAAINLIDDRSQHTVAGHGVGTGLCARPESMCAVTLHEDRDVLVPDTRTDPRFATSPWVAGPLGAVRFYAATLLRTPAGHAIGTLCVFDHQPHSLDEEQQIGLARLGQDVIAALEHRRRGNRLSETIAELSRSHEQLAHFGGQISHDLKTPLTAILGFAELLQDRPAVESDPVAREYVARCLSSGQRMLGMIEQMLRFASVGGRLQVQPVELETTMGAVVADLGPLADLATIRWDSGRIDADPDQLRVLLQNLVGNAIKYRRPEIPSRVDVTASRRDVAVELRVIDNGRGIPADKRLDVLAPLARLEKDVAGTGLGLATCARIAAAHGGTLHITETPGGGTTVTAVLPTASATG